MEPTVIASFSVWPIVKVFILIALIVYFIFSMLVLRQVKLMTDTVKLGFDLPVKFISYANLFLAAAVFLIALISL